MYNSKGGCAGLVVGLIISGSLALTAFCLIQRRKMKDKEYENEYDEGGEIEDSF